MLSVEPMNDKRKQNWVDLAEVGARPFNSEEQWPLLYCAKGSVKRQYISKLLVCDSI